MATLVGALWTGGPTRPTVDGVVGEVTKSTDPATSVALALPTDRLCPVE